MFPLISKKVIEALEAQLGADQVLQGTALRERYCHIWRMNEPLQALALVLPESTEEVAVILKICSEHQQSVVVHGGLTNLVGSTETHTDDVVIAMERMNRIEEVDAQSRTVTVEAGAILEAVQTAVQAEGLLFPMNFGAKGSAQIGGMIATNAGGLRVFRYGMTRQLVLGLEVVLADGTIISSLKKIIKDNSAYDVKQIFIGAEGTLGIITKAVLKLVEAPQSRTSAFVGIKDYPKVVEFLKFMDAGLAGTLSGFELIWQETFRAMTTAPASSSAPLPYDYPYYVLLESLGNAPAQDQELLQSLLEKALEQQLIEEAVPAQSEADLQWFWKIREDVHAIVARCTFDQHFDISMPIGAIGATIATMTEQLTQIEGVEAVYPFGHVADGNIHFIIGKANDQESLTQQINDVVYGPLQALGGSVSAEHGIGLHKKAYLSLCRSPAEIQLMKTLKQSLDPQGILNPGKVLDFD